MSGLIATGRADHVSAEFLDGGGEGAADVAFVADQHFAAGALTAGSSSAATSRSSRLGDVSAKAQGVPLSANKACSRKPQGHC